MLKLCILAAHLFFVCQPPSGGCVLKHNGGNGTGATQDPAAFGRLCVETASVFFSQRVRSQPPSGGCVLKRYFGCKLRSEHTSRLRAAVC